MAKLIVTRARAAIVTAAALATASLVSLPVPELEGPVVLDTFYYAIVRMQKLPDGPDLAPARGINGGLRDIRVDVGRVRYRLIEIILGDVLGAAPDKTCQLKYFLTRMPINGGLCERKKNLPCQDPVAHEPKEIDALVVRLLAQHAQEGIVEH